MVLDIVNGKGAKWPNKNWASQASSNSVRNRHPSSDHPWPRFYHQVAGSQWIMAGSRPLPLPYWTSESVRALGNEDLLAHYAASDGASRFSFSFFPEGPSPRSSSWP